MNPILIKPQTDDQAQIVFMGKSLTNLSAADYEERKVALWQTVVECLEKLLAECELVVIEGAGSPAEVNLRNRDIVNMKVARHLSSPVLLVGDIDRGGVLASLVGTMELLLPEEQERIGGFLINKFRGDRALLSEGLEFLEQRTGKPVLGVIPYSPGLRLFEEDSVCLEPQALNFAEAAAGAGLELPLQIAVINLPHMSNFTDFQPLEAEAGMSLHYVKRPEEINGAAAVILPGTKTTIADLEWLRQTGLAKALLDKTAAGVPLIGICGGFQMMGEKIRDPEKIESKVESAVGLGLVPMATTLEPEKLTRRVEATVISRRGLWSELIGEQVSGYEIHMGRSEFGDEVEHLFELNGGQLDGFVSDKGQIWGTYLHGIFENENLRRVFINHLRGTKPAAKTRPEKDPYDHLAELVRANVDLSRIYQLIFEGALI